LEAGIDHEYSWIVMAVILFVGGNMYRMRKSLIFVFLIMLAGCSFKQVSQGIYEGAQARNQLLVPPAERLEKVMYPAYGDYEQQRTWIIKRDNGSDSKVP